MKFVMRAFFAVVWVGFSGTAVWAGEPVIEWEIDSELRDAGSCVLNGQDLKGSLAATCCTAGMYTGYAHPSCPVASVGDSSVRNSMISFVGLIDYFGSSLETTGSLVSDAIEAKVEQDAPIPTPTPSVIEFPGPQAPTRPATRPIQ